MCMSSLTTHILPMALLHLPTLLFDFRVIVRKYSNFSNISAGSCHLYKATHGRSAVGSLCIFSTNPYIMFSSNSWQRPVFNLLSISIYTDVVPDKHESHGNIIDVDCKHAATTTYNLGSSPNVHLHLHLPISIVPITMLFDLAGLPWTVYTILKPSPKWCICLSSESI